jgi:diguanylate cyclase (GGDEF)-like protein
MSSAIDSGKRRADSLALRLLRSTRPVSLRHRLAAIRAEIIDRLWLSLFIVAMIGAPLSAMRASTTGWLPIYSMHLAIGVLVACVFFVRKRLPTNFKLGLIMAVFWTIGCAGLASTGLVGPSVWWLSLSILLITALYSVRAGLITALLTCAVTAAAAAGFIQGWLKMPYDANVYIQSVAAWANMVVAVVLLPLLLFSSVTSFHSSTVQLLEEVDGQREMIRQLAMHDELTDVPTLRLATDRLEQAMLGAIRSGGHVAVLFVDLDGFKGINDTHGHDAGDAVLRAVAQRCRDVVRADDTVARRGGDEFIAILKEVQDSNAAVALAQRMLDVLASPVAYGAKELRVGASIGVALYPQHAMTAADMIRAGDAAMYEAKRSGTNQIRVAPPIALQASA